jgi:hypothetical protein
MAQAREVMLGQLREQGPTVSVARARALVFEAAAGRLSADEAARLLARMECPEGGELLALEGGRVTSREIRQLEQHVIDVALRAAGKDAQSAPVGIAAATAGTDSANVVVGLGGAVRTSGLQAAEAALGDGNHLDPEQREAFELLTSGVRWACLTGRPGPGRARRCTPRRRRTGRRGGG